MVRLYESNPCRVFQSCCLFLEASGFLALDWSQGPTRTHVRARGFGNRGGPLRTGNRCAGGVGDLTPKQKPVFVLGAGFTRAFLPGAPLLRDRYHIDSLLDTFKRFPRASPCP